MISAATWDLITIAVIATTLVALAVYYSIKRKFAELDEERLFYNNMASIIAIFVTIILFLFAIGLLDSSLTNNFAQEHQLVLLTVSITNYDVGAIIGSLVTSVVIRFLLVKKAKTRNLVLFASYWFLFLALAFEIVTFYILTQY